MYIANRFDHPLPGTASENVSFSEEVERGPAPLALALEAWRAQLPDDFEGFTDDEVRSWRDRSPGRPVDLG